MASKNSLTAELRDTTGKGAARRLRRSGRIPAVIYGHHEDTRSLSVDARELSNLFADISVENTLITMEIDGEDGGEVRALVRDVQSHPYRPEILHVDFYQIHAGEKLEVDVPVRLTGTAEGVREGGLLEHVLYDLPISCLPADIPEVLLLDVSELEIGDSLHVSDLDLPEGVTTAMDPKRTVCAVVAPSFLEVEEEEEAETPEEIEGVGGTVEPELIGERPEEEEVADTTEQD